MNVEIKFLLLLAVLMAATVLNAQHTTRKRLRENPEKVCGQKAVVDTLVDISSEELRLAGFDKPLRSNVETLFVTNNLACRVIGLNLTIDYVDTSGRMLHSRQVAVVTDIPPGHTRQVSFPTWDRQQSFYYWRSRKPERADGTPFDVAINLDCALTPSAPTIND